MAKIHVQNWTGSESVAVVDMANAGKRGKTCRSFHFSGPGYYGAPDAVKQVGYKIVSMILKLAGKSWANNDHVEEVIDGDYDAVLASVRQIIADAAAAGVDPSAFNIYERVMKGINAPKPKLQVVSDKWSARVDDSGICLADLVDANNEPRMITPSHRQTHAKAYAIAAKVWPKLVALAADKNSTMHRAGDVLGEAGAKLHYYCAMD
jgi:hypothetical protein